MALVPAQPLTCHQGSPSLRASVSSFVRRSFTQDSPQGDKVRAPRDHSASCYHSSKYAEPGVLSSPTAGLRKTVVGPKREEESSLSTIAIPDPTRMACGYSQRTFAENEYAAPTVSVSVYVSPRLRNSISPILEMRKLRVRKQDSWGELLPLSGGGVRVHPQMDLFPLSPSLVHLRAVSALCRTSSAHVSATPQAARALRL